MLTGVLHFIYLLYLLFAEGEHWTAKAKMFYSFRTAAQTADDQ